MRALLSIPALLSLLSACDYGYQYNEYDYDYGYEDDWYGPAGAFARGDALESVAVFHGGIDGFALGSDELGAVGMVGMVCSVGALDGYLRVDVEGLTGTDTVVDALPGVVGGIDTLSVSGAAVSITEFSSEWSGASSVGVAWDGPVEGAALSDGAIWLARTVDGACLVEQRARDGQTVLASHALDGACASPLVTEPASEVAWISTTRATWQVGASAAEIGAPADRLAAAGGRVAFGAVDGAVRVASDRDTPWTASVDGQLTGVAWIGGGRLVVASNPAARGLLTVFSSDGALLERIETSEPISQMKASPQGGVVAARGTTGLHLIQVR